MPHNIMKQTSSSNVEKEGMPPSPVAEEEEDDDESRNTTMDPDHHNNHRHHPFFTFMAQHPWPFLVVLPVVFSILLAVGWSTTNDKIEDHVTDLWIPTSGAYARNRRYADSLDKLYATSSAFAALALPRNNNDNMMTAEHLNAVRQRMQETENTTVVYKNITFTWDDFCAVNTDPYRFPCLRFSPMDLFQESRWTFTTDDREAWYRNIVQDRLIAPRVARFGGFTSPTCREACRELVEYRTVVTNNPLALFADAGNLEYNHPCKMCLEENYYEQTIQDLHDNYIAPDFLRLSEQVQAFDDATMSLLLNDKDATTTEMEQRHEARLVIIQNLQQLAATVTTNQVAEFYNYYTTRSLYAQLGAATYLANYTSFQREIETCQRARDFGLPLACPPHPINDGGMNMTLAMRDLKRHADNFFSSVTTAGAPFPFWSHADGTGVLFQPNPASLTDPTVPELYPVSGSGIDMSADLDSLKVFLDGNNTADPASETWQMLVERNPLYAWFMASLTPADPNTVCANGNLTGTPIDPTSNALLASITPRWCTPFDVPNANETTLQEDSNNTKSFSKQYFARMWYDLLISSDGFLNVMQGQDDPYTWTTGAGCDYNLGDERFSYTGQSTEDIMSNASRLIYNIDEGVLLGAVDPHILMGGVSPPIGDYSFENPIQQVKVLQNLYGCLDPRGIVRRVKNCARPGGPVELTQDEAEELLIQWKEAMEDNWNRGWDDKNDGTVQFVSFFDDGGVIGSTGRMLTEITLSNTSLTILSIAVITFFSAIFLFSFDLVESRVLITLVGVGLVVLLYFSALGFGLLTGVKINVTIGWTLPFVIIGLGVDDVYIILMALKNQGGYTLEHWLNAMKEVVIPVSMTSLVNASMFAILNVSDIPAVYLTSRVALYCVIFLYLSVIFCFPAYCYLDLLRQKNKQLDIVVCLKSSVQVQGKPDANDFREKFLYDSFYKPIVLNKGKLRYAFHAVIMVISSGLFAAGCYGVTQRSIGLGLADFFPKGNPAGKWAEIGEDTIATWAVSMNWGALDYNSPATQMKIIKSFEDFVLDERIAEADTKQLWLADFLIWTTRHCNGNFDRPDFNTKVCGRDQLFNEDTEPDSICAGTWTSNVYGLRIKNIDTVTDDTCLASEGGICRKAKDMHPDDLEEIGVPGLADETEFCPVIVGWSNEKWVFCLGEWRKFTGGGSDLIREPGELQENSCGAFVEQEGKIVWPILYAASPTLFSHSLFSHEETLDMIRDTRRFCDDLEDIHCWLKGIPYDYWTQYEDISSVLVRLCGFATLGGFGIAFGFLVGRLLYERNHPFSKILAGSLIGAGLIACTMIMTLTTVIGLGVLAGVNLTGFSNMSFCLSIGFTVEYSVHIVSRFLRASTRDAQDHQDRVDYTMSFLMLPTFMSFVSSTIGVMCLALTEFAFIDVFFFRPLIIVMFVSYFFGCWFLPMILTYLDFDVVKLGSNEDKDDDSAVLMTKDANDAEKGDETKLNNKADSVKNSDEE